MKDREKINLIKNYGHLIVLPEGFTLKDCSHSTCDEVHICVKDGEREVEVWKDRIWCNSSYDFNNKQDYWFFNTRKGYEFLNPKIETIFCRLKAAEHAANSTKKKAEKEESARRAREEQVQIERLKAIYE